jgi:hypothetical protein
MIEDKTQFVLGKTAVIEGSPAWNHLVDYLKTQGFQVKTRDIYIGNQKLGRIGASHILVDKGTRLEELCRRYNPPSYNPKRV